MNYQCINIYQEVTVSSIEEIYDTIKRYIKFHNFSYPNLIDEEPRTYTFFRGQSNSAWDITPSLIRSNIKESKLLEIYMPPKENLSLFGTIAYIQHYHQSTRFIDFTFNPDIAIYFACSGHNDKNGALYIYPYLPHKAEWYTATVLSELTHIQGKDEISVQDFSQIILQSHPEFRERFLNIEDLNGAIISFLDHGFMVLPDSSSYHNNVRLQRQQGCFYVCGVEFSKPLTPTNRWFSQAGKNKFNPHSAVTPDELRNGDFLVKIIIPKDIKPQFLYQLSSKGITESFLFPTS
ncbi:hypothetical protein B5E64_13610 [Drancourtella sp. An12]|mgnify:CR=1 FL=1|uniref:FRG domain-containing protein n=1 Tax=Drancourtella sp. An12 TaxID=1965548 RepID=UPI000B3808E6|nr:FRG domain-containing protein [Drancourtella sp. An12]OUQ44591.1 hypothetical protein B5E64_13610 [Drancourtella sp. An12]